MFRALDSVEFRIGLFISPEIDKVYHFRMRFDGSSRNNYIIDLKEICIQTCNSIAVSRQKKITIFVLLVDVVNSIIFSKFFLDENDFEIKDSQIKSVDLDNAKTVQ